MDISDNFVTKYYKHFFHCISDCIKILRFREVLSAHAGPLQQRPATLAVTAALALRNIQTA